MKISLPLTAILALSVLAPTSGAQTAPDNPSVAVKPKPSVAAAEQTPLQRTIEAYLRNLYAFGPEVQLTVSAPKETPIYKKWWFWAVVAVSAYVVYEIATSSSNSSNATGRETPMNGTMMTNHSLAAPRDSGYTLLRF